MIHPYEYSIVVVAREHNPTLLNPDFLERNGIVPAEWGWEVDRDALLTTPPYSRVRYTSGVLIESESQRFKAAIQNPGEYPLEHPVADIVREYVKVIKHVAYTAIGINFHGYIPDSDPLRTLLSSFAAPDLENRLAPTAYTFTVQTARREDALVGLRVAEGTRTADEEQKEPIIDVRANYHRELESSSAVVGIAEILDGVKNDWNDFYDIVRALGLERTTAQ